ncbi:DDE-type integrase/transposase/recombinase [Marichromatium gracile]|uniref:DDE-type integrase/transposase/recombinase n=1 Tax=Marichromatium gracile TaxID=1048 RepID=UPI00398C2B5F
MRVLDQVISVRGRPERLRFDNGPEFTSTAFQRWAAERAIVLDFISPGKPTQNGFIERFNGSSRPEVLDDSDFIKTYRSGHYLCAQMSRALQDENR